MSERLVPANISAGQNNQVIFTMSFSFPIDVFTTYGCQTVRFNSPYFSMNADGARWPSDGFCTALPPDPDMPNNRYVCRARLYNYQSARGINFGHIGIAYNVQDEDNFDVVYYRLVHVICCVER